ncbi:MAG: leucine-rich repeat domain-containing protein [Kiritimatiellae bacterium]|nr:leucine-rich repeat domain-containing protein [Kiritimatiellia bacterium]
MRAFFLVLAGLSCAVLSGCFSHREAPERPVTAGSLEEAVAQREAVQRLVLNGAALTSIPAELASMPNLATLYLREAAVTDFAGLASLANLRELDLSGVKMEKAPAELEALPHLARLYLSGCGLKEFPASIASSRELVYLNLDRNRLASLPDALPAGLRWLRLNGNGLAALPESIGSLADLRRIYLNDNALEALPASFETLTALEDVALAGNRLAAFPAVLVSLPHLRNLDLRGNGSITELPPNIGDMKALRTLTLSGCRLPKEERDRIRKALPDCVINF